MGTNPNEKIVNTVCESTKKIFGDYVLNISNAGTGPMHAFTNILSVPCISVGASYIFCRMHSPNEFAKIDLLHKTTKNICVLLENFSRSKNQKNRTRNHRPRVCGTSASAMFFTNIYA